MIELRELYDKCFADKAGECSILDDTEQCGTDCPFYKPRACKDWVKVKMGDEMMICTPEEFERRFKSEEDSKPKAVYWHIKRVPKG